MLRILFYVRQSTLSRPASYKITLVCLSICPSMCPSVRPSLSFLKIRSLVFSDIVHDDSWSWYLVTDWARFLKKKIGPKTRFFSIFSSFCPLVFLEIAYHDSLQQYIISSRGKNSKKNFRGLNFGQNLPKSCPKLDFRSFSQVSSGSLALLEIEYHDTLQ